MPSDWINHVKKYQVEYGCTYKEALQKSRITYVKGGSISSSIKEASKSLPKPVDVDTSFLDKEGVPHKPFKGEKHGFIVDPEKQTVSRANYMGPSTAIIERLEQKIAPLGRTNILFPVDKIALLHDVLYGLARTDADIKKADQRFMKALNKSTDAKANIAQGRLISMKILTQDLGVSPSYWTTRGELLLPENAEIRRIAEGIVRRLTKEGY